MRMYIGSGLALGLVLSALSCSSSTDSDPASPGGAAGAGSGGLSDGSAGTTTGSGGADSGSGGDATGGSAGDAVGGSGGGALGGSAGELPGGSGGAVGGSGGEPAGGSAGAAAAGPICMLPAEPGNCLAYMPSYYFDAQLGRCAEFIYGGCGGNDNRFPTYEACRAACGGPEEPVCSLPADTGPCDGAFMRYWYSEQTGQCEQFSYGGCEGNANNFETAEACLAACG